MKKNIFVSLVLFTALIGFAGVAGAQAGPPGHHPGHGGWDGPHAGDLGGPGEFHRLLRMLKMADDLGVTDEQIEQIEEILDTARPQFEALGEQLRTQGEAWREANDPAEFDEAAARQFADSQAALRADMMVQHMQTRAGVLSILTPEQREALEQIKSDRHGRRGGKRHSKPCR